MKSSLLLLLLLPIFICSNSLYTDSPTVESNPSSLDIASDMIDSATDIVNQETTEPTQKSSLIHTYTTTVFDLSQLTHQLTGVTGESILFSDIQRLDEIAKTLKKKLDVSLPKKNAKTANHTKLQHAYQNMVFDFYALSPYIPYLVDSDFKFTQDAILYIKTIQSQFETNVGKQLSAHQQLNIGQSSLPFQPNSPEQLAFSLENQMTQSMLNMFQNTSGAGSAMPYAGISSPANADYFNQSQSATPFSSTVPTPNANPLQMMNYIPSF